MGVRLVQYNRNNNNGDGSLNRDHDELINRDLLNQHPIYAITGLQEILNILEDSIQETNTRLNQEVERINLDIESINKEIEKIIEIINNLNIIKDVEDTNSIDMSYDKTSKILKADVKIYNDVKNGNAIQILTGGLYAPKFVSENSNTISWTSKTSDMCTSHKASVNISKENNNAIIEKSDGLYSESFEVSKQNGNILKKESDGYFVQGPSEREDNAIQLLDDGYYVRNYSNVKIVTQDEHNFEVGDFIFYHPTGLYKKALAIDSYDSNIIGMVTKIIDDNTFEYMWGGFYATDIFDETHDIMQGMPLYISDTDAVKATQEQPDISKTVGYPVENLGIIISIERGIQYNQEASIGDFKSSANTYNVRSDGFIKVIEGVDYKQVLIQRLLDALDDEFKNNYMMFNDENKTVQFINTEDLLLSNKVPEGLNLFIKAF